MAAATLSRRSPPTPLPVPSPAAGGGRWTGLRSVQLTPPGTSPRLLLRPLPAGRRVKVTAAERRRQRALAEAAPRLLLEFADRLEAVFGRGAGLMVEWRGAEEVLKGAERKVDRGSARGLETDRAEENTLAAERRSPREVKPDRHTAETAAPAERRASQAAQGGHQRDTSDSVAAQHCQPPANYSPSVAETAHAAAASVLREKDILLGTPGSEEAPAKPLVTPHSQPRWAYSVDTSVTDGSPEERQKRLPLNRDKKRRREGDGESESNRTFSVFTTPRRGGLDSGFRRPWRPRVDLQPAPVAERGQHDAADRFEAEGGPGSCDVDQTPRRRGAPLKPVRLSGRWQELPAGSSGRPRPDLEPSPAVSRRRQPGSPWDTPRRQQPTADHPPADDTPRTTRNTPRRRHSQPQPRTASDRCQDIATPRHQQPEFKLPSSLRTPRKPPQITSAGTASAATPRAGTASAVTPRGRRGGVALTPGGSGDRLRRVHRWLESSVSVADPAEERAARCRFRTPSLAGASTVSGGRRRPRVEYTEEEVQLLVQGVQKYGRDFRAIRLAYDFHPSRTTVDLYDKWRRMKPPAGAGDAGPRAEER